MKKWTLRILKVIAALILIIAVFIYIRVKDRHPGYSVDIKKTQPQQTNSFKAGFAALTITPEIIDTWNDVNNDAKYNEEDGDTYNDNNNNGKFDAYWIAGFDSERAANGVHDDVWTRAAIFDDGHSRIALVSIDAIGFGNDDVVDIRKMIPDDAAIDYVLIASTHTHESYDLLGIWGIPPFESGINDKMMEYVKSQTLKAILEANSKLRPAKLAYAQNLTDADTLVKDTRKPIVKDSGIRLIQAIDKEDNSTLGVIVGWANHPETVWSDNLLISSDFPHYIREGIEKGIYNGDTLVQKGLGGTAIFFNGALGGLMCTHPSLGVKDLYTDTIYNEPSFDKVRAVGYTVASLSLNALAKPDTTIEFPSIALNAKTLHLPLDNNTFIAADILGLLNRGVTGWITTRSEIAAFNIGPASFLSIPGELYPEILNGGVVAKDGRDFNINPVETPALRDLMPGKYKFAICLSNDEIGYIVPKSEWDVEEPYGYNKKQYGEGNSLGDKTAPILYRELSELLKELK